MIKSSNMASLLIFLYFFIFLFGLIIGSFLNCVIYRLSLPQRIKAKRSFCPHCQYLLCWKDLIPIFSFLVLYGKCRYCQRSISLQYPLVELATGLLFVLVLNYEFGIMNYELFNFEVILNSLFLILTSCFLIIIFVFDLKHFIIPDKIIYPAIIITFLYRLLEGLGFGTWNLEFIWNLELGIWNFKPLIYAISSAILASAFFFSIFLISRGKWLGFGDVKLAFFMGLFLGFPNILVALFFAFFIGAIIGIGLIILKRKQLKSQVPFGPFLVTGTFIALFWGQAIIDWYLYFFL